MTQFQDSGLNLISNHKTSKNSKVTQSFGENLIKKQETFLGELVIDDLDHANFRDDTEVNKLEARYSKLIPDLNQKDVQNMVPDEDDELKLESET